MPDLTFTQPHPGGRIVLMLGQHRIAAIFPPTSGAMDWRKTWRWRFWLCSDDGIALEGSARTEAAARAALIDKASAWLQRAGIEP